jgi:ADP-ribose pyrophosphatase YjhB (NUDIX family)
LKHYISAGALVVKAGQVLLVRHHDPGRFDFWAPPGGGVENEEELADAAKRETFEETGIVIEVKSLAYIDELIDQSGRLVKFWFVAKYVSGQIDVSANPAKGEMTVDAGWFSKDALPDGHVFPDVLRDRFWRDLEDEFAATIKLPLRQSIF